MRSIAFPGATLTKGVLVFRATLKSTDRVAGTAATKVVVSSRFGNALQLFWACTPRHVFGNSAIFSAIRWAVGRF
ncbi:hypothetical protein Psta_3261 [Pirellula staleyi DSM 6068]|uniref:Uncharacterized protein n=1 Tax=Pirellula staleyi (strain ATCC 27377 / DSM 6068 / ICPB 4128) TaxID=530564 RepID=D2QX85_PIRSD|nr:hypothetical protein Psta_3261 [Pirellula staleyi DSM 6068]